MKYEHLLSPVRIGNTYLKNRTLYPDSSPHFLQGPEEFPADSYFTYVGDLAKNGAAVITVSEWNNPDQRKMPGDGGHMQYFNTENSAVLNYLSQMADDVHFYGSKLLVGILMKFPTGYSIDGAPVTPMPGRELVSEYRQMSREMMDQVIDEYVEKLRQYKIMGYDGFDMRVEEHLIPQVGKRDDEFGGSVENRTRFLLNFCQRVKEKLGRDFIISLVLAGEQPYGYQGGQVGYHLEDTVEFARLAQGKVDILQIREMDMAKSHPTGFTFRKGEHNTIRYSAAIKAAAPNILTAPIGGFQDPDEIEEYIASGKCDMIGMARAFICDPEYGAKLYAGRGEDIVPCIRCNKCHGTKKDKDPDPYITICSVNPLFGIRHKVARMLPDKVEPKNVAVIGGGPAGMKAAIEAAGLGHRVTLYEKSDHLGGQLIHSDYSSFKWPLAEFKSYLIRTLYKSDVEVILNHAPTTEELKAKRIDAVLAATGAVPGVPNIPGLRNEDGSPAFKNCVDVYGHENELGKHVIIIGGSEVGIETAMHLCECGHDVTVLTRQDELGHNCSKLHYITMAWCMKEGADPQWKAFRPAWELYENLTGILNAETTAVKGTTVYYTDADGEHSIEGDSIVVCGGMKPNIDEAMSYAGQWRFFNIGDSNGGGDIQHCMRDAFSKAHLI